MSQKSLLDNVHSWSRDECREQIGTAVPKLIHYLNSANDLHREAEIIHIICTTFLPVLNQDQAESVVFSKVAHKTAECVENTLQRAQDLASQEDSDLQQVGQDITNLVQMCTDLIGCLGLCVGHMTPEGRSVPISSFHSLPASVLHVIERSYSHCKRSSEIYGNLLNLVSQNLSSLFRQANELQMAFISLTERIEPSDEYTEQDIQDIVIVIHGLFEISQVVASLEVKVMLTLWKAISRVSCQHKSVVCNRLDLDMMLSSLASFMCESYRYMFSLPKNEDIDRATLNKTCKVLGFQMRVLQMLLKEFAPYAGHALSDVCKLLVTLKREMPPCLSAKNVPDFVIEEVERQILISVPPIVSTITPCRDFIVALTNTEDAREEDHLPRLLVILTVLDSLQKCSENVLSSWVSSVNNFFVALFKAVSLCHAEMNLPLTLSEAKSPDSTQRVSLYEYVITKISGFVACLPATDFQALETALITNILSRQVLQATLALDVWCFVARYSTPELCRSHCIMIGHLLHQSSQGTSPQCCHLVHLLRRLLRFMAPEDQAEFIKEFPLEWHQELWSVIPLAIFTPLHLKHLVDNLFAGGITTLESWCSAEEKTKVFCNRVIGCMWTMTNVCTSTGVMEHNLTDQDKQRLQTCCIKLWDQLSPHSVLHVLPWAYTKSLLKLTTHIASHLDNKTLLKILRIGSTILSKDVPVHIRLSVLTFLVAASKNKIHSSNEQSKVFDELSKLFNAFLSEKNPALNQIGIETFANFAEETPYESIVTASLDNNPDLQEKVVGYLKEAEDTESEVDGSIEDLQHQARVSEQFANALPELLYPKIPQTESLTDTDGPEPMDHMDEYTSSLESLRQGVNTLTSLRTKGRLPDWLVDELNVIQMQISELL